MITRLLLVIGVFVLGSEATSFTSKSDLKTAVDSCLVNDPPAECDDMPSWDVRLRQICSTFQAHRREAGDELRDE